MKRVIAFACAVAVLLPVTVDAQTSDTARVSVLAVVDSAMARINRGEMAKLPDLMIAEALTYAVSSAGDATRYMIRSTAASRQMTQTGIWTERGFNPDVKISGRLAVVWLPYDFYIDGRWSHCGIDLVTLVRIGQEWKIASFGWTVEQPPACSAHPDGPPKR